MATMHKEEKYYVFYPVKVEYIVMGHAIHHKLDLQDNGDL